MEWTFAKNDGGRDSGFHDAGVETFKGNFDRYLARELIQNSLDARHDPNKPVTVKFELLKLDRKDIPDVDYLKAAFARCAEYWHHEKKAKAFFDRAEKLIKCDKVVALRIGDYNTTGVLGSDTERSKNWYNLIRCAGSSSKAGGEGGSFGIGKNAPFAASQMRTVLYSTFNIEQEYAFQGVSTLVSHLHAKSGLAQPTGYLGGTKGSSIRVKNDIPPKFRRKEHGTDIIVLGFPAEGDSWKSDLMYSVLDNFWPAIHFEELEVVVGDTVIKKANLGQLLEGLSGEEDFTAHLYYKAFTEPTHPFTETLRNLKGVSLYLLAGESDMPKKLAMVRKTGMKIFEKQFRSVIPFCGVFICRNEDGNRILREMEPPRHDMWDPDHPDKGANKRIESEYVQFVRDCIRKLAPTDDSKVISIPGLNKFLPDDEDSPEEAFDGDVSEESKDETADRSPLPEKIPIVKIDVRKRAMQPDHSRPKDGSDDTEEGEGEGTGGIGEPKGGEQKGGTAGGGAGRGTGKAGPSLGTPSGGLRSGPALSIRYRTFSRDPASGVYTVAVTPEERPKSDCVNLVVWTVGDDQRAPAELKTARLPSGEDLPVSRDGVVGPVRLEGANSIQLEVVLKEPIRVAMEITAHEAQP